MRCVSVPFPCVAMALLLCGALMLAECHALAGSNRQRPLERHGESQDRGEQESD
jgi:hypothetical protein